MKIRNQQDFWAGLLFAGAGALFAIGGSGVEIGDSQRPGEGYFPLLLGVVMMVLGGIVNFKAVTFETDDGTPLAPTDWRVLLATLAAVLLAGLVLPVIGLPATIVLMAAVLVFGAGRFSARNWLGASLLGGLICWLVFVQLLGLTLLLWPLQTGAVPWTGPGP